MLIVFQENKRSCAARSQRAVCRTQREGSRVQHQDEQVSNQWDLSAEEEGYRQLGKYLY
jgi:hypothetical protein